MPLVSRISIRPIRQRYCENALDEHGDIHSRDSDLLEDVHCIACQWRIQQAAQEWKFTRNDGEPCALPLP